MSTKRVREKEYQPLNRILFSIHFIIGIKAHIIQRANFKREVIRLFRTLTELQEIYRQGDRTIFYPSDIPAAERAQGAIMGAFIGDALGLGCHWIYDYDELWRDYGAWVDDYVDPKAIDAGGAFEMIAAYRYRRGVRAGMSSQSGQLLQIMLESAACGKSTGSGAALFDLQDYIKRVTWFFESVLLPEAAFETDIDVYNAHKGVNLEQGTFIGAKDGIKCFSGRYTSEEVRHNFDYWFNRGKKNGRWWHHESGVSMTSTSEGAQWGVILAALYQDPEALFYKAYDFLHLWYTDRAFITMQLMYIMTVHGIINGVPLEQYENYNIALFDRLGVIGKMVNSFDDIQGFKNMMQYVKKSHLLQVVDDRFAPLFFGQNCHVNSLIPCAYYYALKNSDNFENGVLTAVNSSGNNMARATLTGALIGAMAGIGGIPRRFIHGLTDTGKAATQQGQYLLSLAQKLSG